MWTKEIRFSVPFCDIIVRCDVAVYFYSYFYVKAKIDDCYVGYNH